MVAIPRRLRKRAAYCLLMRTLIVVFHAKAQRRKARRKAILFAAL